MPTNLSHVAAMVHAIAQVRDRLQLTTTTPADLVEACRHLVAVADSIPAAERPALLGEPTPKEAA